MVNLDIITGFLGAGKTTLISRLLAEAYAGERPVLIENEFGEVSIDDSLIEDQEVQVRLLASGCICCTLKGGFIEGITQVVEQYSPSRIIIEPTGLADPLDILLACEEAGEAVPVRVSTFITMANAENLLALLTVGGDLFKKQISTANILVLNRTKLLSSGELTETMGMIRGLNPSCVIVDQDRQQMDALSILTLAEDAAKPNPEHNHDHGIEGLENVSSLSFFPERSFSPEELTGLLAAFSKGWGGQVLRAKGFFKKAGGGYSHLEYVYGRGESLDSAYTGSPKFVVIGTGLDEATLKRLLEEE